MSKLVVVRCRLCGFLAAAQLREITEVQGWLELSANLTETVGLCPACAGARAEAESSQPPAITDRTTG